MINDNAQALEDANAKWLEEQFEYEYCSECGGDTDDHVVGSDPFGLRHSYCKPIEVGERVTFEYGDTPVVGVVERRLGPRLKIVSDGDGFVETWITDTDAMRWQTP